MSSAVWKYKLEAKTCQEVEMPWGSKILKLASTGSGVCLWVLVDIENAKKQVMKLREFRIYATGEEIKDASQLEYIGTLAAESPDGHAEVIHCFETLRIIV